MNDEAAVITPNVLTWKECNQEINELHRTFNSVIKTMLIAHHPSDNLDTQLLNFSDAYYIDQYQDDPLHKGVCLANIGMILL